MSDLKTELDKILKEAKRKQFGRSWKNRESKAFFLAGVHFVIDKLLERSNKQ